MKGPDFVSRLRGFVNIKGPNPISAVAAWPPAAARSRGRRTIPPSSSAGPSSCAHVDRFYPQLIDPDTKEAAISGSVLRLTVKNSCTAPARSNRWPT